MQTISAKNRQSLLDISTEFTGTAENVFALALANGISITDDLNSALVLSVPQVEKEESVMQVFSKTNPATKIIQTPIRYNEGIDYWEIGENFEVQ